MGNKRAISPWAWIPTLYLAQGLPYVAVMTVSVIMYKRLGISNTDIALYTGWLYLPWVIKPLWSPIVDIISSKRWWTVAMQLALAVGFAAIALLLPGPMFFRATLGAFWLVGFASATNDIASDGFYMLALDTRQQSFYVGIRTTFYRVAVLAGQGGLVYLAGHIEETTGNIPFAWQWVFGGMSIFFIAAALYHWRVMPRPAADATKRNPGDFAKVMREFADTFISFFKKPQIATALAFMLLYRLPEAQLVKLINPFLLDSPDVGGLGLSTKEVGIVYGTVGVAALTVGGIIGGIVAARGGLRPWIRPMAWAMSLTCLTFVYLSFFPASSLLVINLCVLIEQFGYGFGTTAYTLYLIYYARGERQTSHYAIATGFMALGMMLPGMAAGWLQEQMGYQGFFIWTMVCCTATIAVAYRLRIK